MFMNLFFLCNFKLFIAAFKFVDKNFIVFD